MLKSGRVFLILSVFMMATPVVAQEQEFPICGPTLSPVQTFTPKDTPADEVAPKKRLLFSGNEKGWGEKRVPKGTSPSLRFEQYGPLPEQLKCEDTERRLSYFGFDHCRMHPEYQKVFSPAGCSCSTGQCRPTQFKIVKSTPENPEGVEIMIDGIYYSVPPAVLHKMHPKMSPLILEYEAHVCPKATNDPKKPWEIECAWIRLAW